MVRIRDILTKQLTFFSLTILQRGPNSRKTILFKVLEGGGQLYSGYIQLFPGGGGARLLIPMETCRTRVMLSWLENEINNCVSTSPKCTYMAEALARLL